MDHPFHRYVGQGQFVFDPELAAEFLGITRPRVSQRVRLLSRTRDAIIPSVEQMNAKQAAFQAQDSAGITSSPLQTAGPSISLDSPPRTATRKDAP